MNTLTIQHTSDNSFFVSRLSDGKRTSKAVEITPPNTFQVDAASKRNLSRELRWYLEKFLEYPFHPDTDVASRVQDALKEWGRQAFNALFDNREGGKMLDDAIRDGYKNLHLQISSDDPRVLSWPWEALRDGRADCLAHTCRIERRLNRQLDPIPLSEKLPKDRVNILLITARPYARDVRYRSISRLLVDLIEKRKIPAHVHLLRPPTFEALRSHLAGHPHFYYILHFDGHGAYGKIRDPGSPGFTFQGSEGCLVFETDNGKEDRIKAEQLSALLREHAVPAVVLNACQSAMIDEQADGSFASVAGALLNAGVRSVVAMSYSLYVTGTQMFLPGFYRKLFTSGSVAEAVRKGRQDMFAQPKRICVRGKHELEDWLVPVLYQQDPMDFSFAESASSAETAA